jgi:Ca2+-binding EF-hand superfamily protein
MQSTGEPLTDDQVNQLIEDMHVQSDGKIDYKQFARMIIEN